MSKDSIKKYVQALMICSLIVFLYLGNNFDLYHLNKAIGSASLTTLGIVLLISPLVRLFEVFRRLLIIRKHLGIVAFFFALSHSVLSLFFQPARFPLKFFIDNVFAILPGLYAVGILAVLFTISFKQVRIAIGEKRWWSIQNWGIRLALIFALFHVSMLKLTSWLGGKSEGLMPALFVLFVFMVRMSTALDRKIAKVIFAAGILLFLFAFYLTVQF